MVAAEEIEESYACDATGVVKVTIRNLTSSYSREFSLGRWSGKAAVVAPLPGSVSAAPRLKAK